MNQQKKRIMKRFKINFEDDFNNSFMSKWQLF